MADNLTSQSTAPATPPAATVYRSYLDSGGVEHLQGVVEYVSGGSAGAWTVQQVDLAHGLPTNLLQVGTSPVFLGQAASTNSIPVVIASDQAIFPEDPASGGGTITAADVGSTSTTNAAGQVIVTGTPTAGSSIQTNLTGQNAVFIRVLGTFNGTLTFERSSDNGTNWVAVAAEELSLGTAVTSYAFSDNNTYIFRAPVAGQINFRVRCTARTSGTAAVNLQTTYRQPAVSVTQAATWGVNVTQVAGASVATGHGTAAGSVRVELPTDGTGQVNAVQSGTWNVGTVTTVTTVTNPVTVTGTATPAAGTANGASLSRTLSAATTNGTNVKASAGTLYSVRATNFSTTNAAYVKLYNVSGTPNVGTDTVFDTIAVPAAVSASQPSVVVWSGPSVGVAMGTGIGFGITGALADNDTTAVALNQVALTIVYK